MLGKKLSRQSWAITDKIKEVDDFMRANKANKPGGKVIREMHPEVAFCALNGGTPMRHSKKRAAGVAERLAILSKYWNRAEACSLEAASEYLRKEVARDDILDAIAGAVMATKAPELVTLPEIPALDDEGLAMEMVFWAGEPE